MINAFCYYFGRDSWSLHARNFFTAWQRQEEVIVASWDKGPRWKAKPAGFGTPRPDAPGIGLGPVELMPPVSGSKRIAYIAWETTRVPREKIAILREMDEVWTPSSWGRDTFLENGLSEDKVRVVPEGVDADIFRPSERKRDEGRPFRFLFVGKWEARKGVETLLHAYRQEFAPEEPVELVLHAWNPYIKDFDPRRWIKRALGGQQAPPIRPTPPLTEAALVRLYNDCDAFVLPTRGEGWGLPITEAMACALPVIVTAYSAPLDYLREDIAYLIPVARRLPVHDPLFFAEGEDWGEWAEPDMDALRRLMRQAYENRDEAREKGRRARAEIEARWTWDHAVTKARKSLWER